MHSSSKIDAVMQPFIDAKELSGAVTLVADDQQILHLSAVGLRDIEKHLPMQTDSIFWIASMTKLITATAIMMLADEKKLSVNDPVAKYIPGFAQLKTADGIKHEIKLWHLLTHTSGLAEPPGDKAFAAKNLEQLMPTFLDLPLKFAPGEKWDYCQSSINTLGRVVEVVSGQPFEIYLAERLFAPLGMKDTTFYPTPAQWERVAKSYLREKNKITATSIKVLPQRIGHREHYPAANGGLFSTASDYARFCQMLLCNGTWQGKQYLSKQAIQQMTQNQTGKMKVGFVPGSSWGLGFAIVEKPMGTTETLSPGTFGHGGAYGTQAWIDPVKKRIQILMIQCADVGNGDDSPFRSALHESASRI